MYFEDYDQEEAEPSNGLDCQRSIGKMQIGPQNLYCQRSLAKLEIRPFR